MWKSGWMINKVYGDYALADNIAGACVPILITACFYLTTHWEQKDARWLIEKGIMKIGEDYG
jgi:hypothetical protein